MQMKNMTTVLKRGLLFSALLGVVTIFLGCHTAHGFGQDVESAGEKIQQKTE
jgi:predicted small secreted protein